MQTQNEIRQLLEEHGLQPQKGFGQNFLIDLNLMRKLLELAELKGDETVLEIGPGTGSLTEGLLARAARVVSAEIDHGMCELLRGRLGGRENFTLIEADALAGKHAIAPVVLDAVGCNRPAALVSNLPYNVATPLVIECLLASWRAMRAGVGVRFDRLTFTVQQEVAERFVAQVDSSAYGPVSVLIALLGATRIGQGVPGTAFWPPPNVASRMVRIDFDAGRSGKVRDVETLQQVLSLAFAQRRKQIGSIIRRKDSPFSGDALSDALAGAGVERTARAEQVAPDAYLAMANALAQ